MKTFQKVRLFAGGFGAALVANWVGTDVRAQQSPTATNTNIRVCVGKDGVMRLAGAASCPAGTKPVDLKSPDYPTPDSPDDKGKSDGKSCTAEKQRLDALQERLRTLEQSPDRAMRNRVTAPFQVFGRDGKLIFLVAEDRTASIYDASGVRVAQMGVSKGGGYVSTKSSDNKVDVGMEAGSSFARIAITDSGTERLTLGRDQQGPTYALRVRAPGGISGLGIRLIGIDCLCL